METAAEPTAAKHFAFVVPMRAEAAVRLASLHLAGPGIRASSAQSLEAPPVTATRTGAGRIALRWDASKSPMLLVRDAVSGEVLSFARGGASEVATGRDQVVVTASGRARQPEMQVRIR
jgi:hypothetical protein